MKNIFDQTELPLSIKKGSRLSLPVYYKDAEGVAIDLTGYTAKAQVRRTPDADDPADITLSTSDASIVITAATGLITVNFSSASTLALDSDYKGTWDLFLIPPSSGAFYLIGGDFEIIPSTTKV